MVQRLHAYTMWTKMKEVINVAENLVKELKAKEEKMKFTITLNRIRKKQEEISFKEMVKIINLIYKETQVK